MRCKYSDRCNNNVWKQYSDKFCYQHFYINRYQYNLNKDDLGIVKFAFEIFPDRFSEKYGIAEMHKEMLWTVLYDEPGWQREDRANVIATFRGGAKTSWFSFILPLYLTALTYFGIYVGDYRLPPLDYIVLKGKTGRGAQKSLYNIQNAFRDKRFQSIFGNLSATIQQTKQKTAKDTGQLLITSTQIIIESLGIDQQIRGANILGRRPKIAIIDDPETTKNTKTEERRKANTVDLLDETFPALDDVTGRCVYIGNMVHEDCLLKNLLQNSSWKKSFYTLTYKDEKGVEHITWPGRFTFKKIEAIKKFYQSHPSLGLAAFYRNFYNINKTDVNPIIQEDLTVKYLWSNGLNWIERTNARKETIVEQVFISVGYDAAITQRSGGSRSSIIVEAQTAERKKYILDYSYGTFDSHDRYLDSISEEDRPKIMAINGADLAKVVRKGGIEECVRMIIKYNADAFCMGTESQQMGHYMDVQDLVNRLNIRISMFPLNSSLTTKITRLRDGIIRQFENSVFYLTKDDMFELKTELETFPQSKLDILDSLYFADQAQQIPAGVPYGGDKINKNMDLIIPRITCEEAWISQ